MILGWGVVCGLDVKPRLIDPDDPSKGIDPSKVAVTPGLAIDCCGREILICEEQEVPLIPEESECYKEKKEEEQAEKRLILCLEYHECKTEAVHLPSIACDQKEKCEFNRIRDSFKIRVISESECNIEPSCSKNCPLFENKTASLHDYLCEKLKKECPECPECPCVILAEIIITPSDNPYSISGIKIDQCSRRKLVYSNSLLYDLIQCFHGDLPHITWINWENGKTIPFVEFENGIYKDGVRVKFDRKMDGNTINKNTFLFLVKMREMETGNYRYEQIPGTVSYEYDGTSGDSICKFEIDSKWLTDVYFGYSTVAEEGGEFLVILRGDFIMSEGDECNPARALDGNFIGEKLPTGNGAEGGDFRSWFYVGPKESPAYEQGAKRGRK